MRKLNRNWKDSKDYEIALRIADNLKQAKKNLGDWTEKYISLDENPFSFKGHEYLREPYQQKHPYKVFEKASQMGLSVLALCSAIHSCEIHGMTVIYFFPTTSDVIDFSQDRFTKLVEGSPHIADLLLPPDDADLVKKTKQKPIDKVTLKRIGKGSLYFRGLFDSRRSRDGRTGAKTKSVDADYIIFDELDEAQPRQKEAAKHRVDHSRWKWILELSTPTVPDYGIDIEFKKSDQRYWLLKCPHCMEWNCVEEEFPGCLRYMDEEKVILACKKCSKPLDSAQGEWVPKIPSRRERRGYHICQLYSSFIDLKEIMDEYRDPNTDLTLFYNHRLGLPYVEVNDRLQREEVFACCRGEIEFPGKANRCSMGVDVGKVLHVCITTPHQSGKPQIVYLGTVPEFSELDSLMSRYDVHTCVIDALPETHSVRQFAERHKRRVYLCYYSENQKGVYNWTDENENGVGQVTVHRTESLDGSFRQIRNQDILIPSRNLSGEIDLLADHCYALVRKKQQDTSGQIFYRYVQIANSDDHYAHSRNYCKIAESKRSNIIPPVIMTGSIKRKDWVKRR